MRKYMQEITYKTVERTLKEIFFDLVFNERHPLFL